MYCTPQPAAPAAARAAIPGRLGTSPMATLTGMSAGVISRTRRITCGKLAPSEPSRGFLTSTMSACPATAGPTSSSRTTLMSSSMSVALRLSLMTASVHAPVSAVQAGG